MSNRRSAEGEYRVEGNVLDELGLDRKTALELTLKAALHQKILQLVKWRGYGALRENLKSKIEVKGVGQECPTHTAWSLLLEARGAMPLD